MGAGQILHLKKTGAYYKPKAESLKLIDAVNSTILIDVTVTPLTPSGFRKFMSLQILDAIKAYFMPKLGTSNAGNSGSHNQ